MSHVAAQECAPGQPMFADLDALKKAAEMLGCELVEKKTYHWFNQHVGDYPLPKGVKVEDLGKNAEYVLRVKPEKCKELGISGEPYELGLMADPNNPGCWVPIYDFWSGGHGLDRAIGSPVFGANREQIKTLCPKLKQTYDMASDALAAKQAGDKIDFVRMSEAHVKYPSLFPTPNSDTDTWVSVVDTSARIGQS